MKNNTSLPTFLTIIIPVYNEDEVLKNFHSRLISVLASIHKPIEILYVNDGSRDASDEIIRQLKKNDSRISYLSLSRNFGKEIALTAGLLHLTKLSDTISAMFKPSNRIFFRNRPKGLTNSLMEFFVGYCLYRAQSVFYLRPS